MAKRTCLACGDALEGTRRRKYCDDRCKRRYHRGARATGGDQPASTSGEIRSTETATMLALSEAKQMGSPLGQTALVLARRLDVGMDTGQGVASLAKQLRETLDAALAAAEVDADLVDELKDRRDRKRAAAG